MSDDEYDESDVANDEEDEYKAPGSRRKTKKKVNTEGFKIRHALKVPRATSYSAQALYDQIIAGDIDLDPDYQREVVWPEFKQVSLIDSVFRNFYIPPIIFAVSASSDGSETRTCIDGKQRLTSLSRFMDGMIYYKDPDTKEKYWYKDAPGKPRQVLPESYQRLFANKQIVCVEYTDLKDDDERDIFQRVQMGMALTPAEKLQAINTPRASFIRALADTHLRDGNLSAENIEWDRSRGADFRCVAQAVFNLDKYGTQKTMGALAALEKWLNEETPLSDKFQARMERTFRVYGALAADVKLGAPLKKYKRLSPIEFILIALLVGVHMDKLSLQQLSAAIAGMREHVRDKHKDIRMNSIVSTTMITYIRALDATKLRGAGEPAGKTLERQKKRRRVREASESDGEIEMDVDSPPPAPPSKGKPIKTEDVPAASSWSTSRPASAPSAAPSTDRLAILRAAKASVARPHSIYNHSPSNGSTSHTSPSIPPQTVSSEQQSSLFGSSLFSRLTQTPAQPPSNGDHTPDASTHLPGRPYSGARYEQRRDSGSNYGDSRGHERR